MENTFADILKGYLIGKKLRHRNRYGREVVLEVEDIKHEHGSRELEPATPQNDWWPATEEWSKTLVCFVDGSSIEVSQSTKLDIVS